MLSDIIINSVKWHSHTHILQTINRGAILYTFLYKIFSADNDRCSDIDSCLDTNIYMYIFIYKFLAISLYSRELKRGQTDRLTEFTTLFVYVGKCLNF